jgi:hypothetical protein
MRNGRTEVRGLAPSSATVPVPVLLRKGTGVKKKGASPQQYVDRPSGEPARRQAGRSDDTSHPDVTRVLSSGEVREWPNQTVSHARRLTMSVR